MTNAAVKRSVLFAGAIVLPIAMSTLQCAPPALAESAAQAAATAAALPAQELDRLLAPVALYPDQLLAQILLCAMEPSGVTALEAFLKAHPTLKGTDLQDAVLKDNFEPSFVALALFPQTVTLMAGQIDRTTPARSGLCHGQDSGVRQHSTLEKTGQRRREPEDDASAGGRDANHVSR